jgi:4-cresol dehydrogenase (hydroxylating) flavoprotein subunit
MTTHLFGRVEDHHRMSPQLSRSVNVTRTLPPGVSEQDFAAALKEFGDIVGDKWVISDEAELTKFDDPYPVGENVAAGPSAVVSPASAEDVQAIVRVANKYGVPLSPISTGKNNGYGGASPRLSGAVVVNTGVQMNKIIEVNEK